MEEIKLMNILMCVFSLIITIILWIGVLLKYEEFSPLVIKLLFTLMSLFVIIVISFITKYNIRKR